MAVKKRKCKYHKSYTEEFIVTNAGVFCTIDAAYKFGSEQRDKKRKQQKVKLEKADKQVKRESKRNDKKHQFQLTKKKIQQWVNHVRDAGLACISCGNTKPTIQYCGGHYKTAGGFPELALNTLNIHRQCNRYCNMALSGNLTGNKTSSGYTAGLIERCGQERVDLLNSKHENPNYDCDQLIAIRAFYSKLIRDNNPDDSGRPF